MTSALQNLLGVLLGYFSAEGVRRLWPRRRATDRITMGVHVVAVPKPIALAERKPGSRDRDGDGFDSDCCWWGDWQDDHWEWAWETGPWHGETHWLPATTEILPARCCPPEVV